MGYSNVKKTIDLLSLPANELVGNLKKLSVELERLKETESPDEEIINSKNKTKDYE